MVDANKSPKANKLLGEQGVTESTGFKRVISSVVEDEVSIPSSHDNTSEKADNHRGWPKPVGAFIGSVVLKGRQKISPEAYADNINNNITASDLGHKKLKITTADGEKIQAIEVFAKPRSSQTIIVFQGQRGNFQSLNQLEHIAEIARVTGANVVAFNYREKLSSKAGLIADATAVTDYVLNTKDSNGLAIQPSNITYYGDSLGGAVAAETAAARVDSKKEQVKVFLARAPKSLAYASKLIDIVSLAKNPVLKALFTVAAKLQKTIPRNTIRDVLNTHFGGDIEAQAAVNKLKPSHVECVRVEDDPIIHASATVGHDDKAVIESKAPNAEGEAKHNVPLVDLKITNNPKAKNALELLRNLANPGYDPQKVLAERQASKKSA